MNEMDMFVSKALIQALRWKVRYDDSNPDVGWGMSPECQLNDILADCEIMVDDDVKRHIIITYKEKYERKY